MVRKNLVPSTKVSVGSVQDMINEMRGVPSCGNSQTAQEENVVIANNEDQKKAKVIPKTVVSANSQWYAKNPDLFEAEIVAMHDFKPSVQFTVLSGRHSVLERPLSAAKRPLILTDCR